MSLNIDRLHLKDLDDLMDLIATVFEDDTYYLKKCNGSKKLVVEMIRNNFRTPMKYCLINGGVYGIKDHGQIKAFIVTANYAQLKAESKVYNEVFEDGHIDDLINNLCQQDHDLLYLLLLGVSKDYRRMGLASCLIDHILAISYDYDLVSDVDNPLSLPIYIDRGFDIFKIDKDYYFVYKNRNGGLYNGKTKRTLFEEPKNRL